jgi:hypothetical protein
VSVSFLLLSLAGPGSAGGSWAEVAPRSWARAGSEIKLSGTFCDGAQAPVTEGPWFAYLDPDAGPPVLMGRVRIAPNTGRSCRWRLTATLRVPRVAPGAYWLQVCDRGCTEGVGDLIGAGRFTVVSSKSPRGQAVELQRLRAQLRRSTREQARQEEILEETGAAVRRAEGRVDALEARVDDLRDRLDAERSDRTAWHIAAVASWCSALILALALVRRRRSRVLIPDTPAELLEKMPVGR